MTPDMQGVIMAIGKSSSVYEKNGPEAAFFKVQPLSPFRSHSLPSPPLLLLCSSVTLFLRPLQCFPQIWILFVIVE